MKTIGWLGCADSSLTCSVRNSWLADTGVGKYIWKRNSTPFATIFLGYMILKQIGVCALGSFMLDPTSTGEALQTLGANPPKNPEPLFKTPEGMPSPPEYLIHTEWDTVEMGRLGFAKVLVNHRIRRIHEVTYVIG